MVLAKTVVLLRVFIESVAQKRYGYLAVFRSHLTREDVDPGAAL